MSTDFEVNGSHGAALFTLKLHRSEGMLLLAMNWKGGGKPPRDVVGACARWGADCKSSFDDSGEHAERGSAENAAAALRLEASAGRGDVVRRHVLNLQHNKLIVVSGNRKQLVVCGSTNFSWRGFYVQANNTIVLTGEGPVKAFGTAFAQYWSHSADTFRNSGSTAWQPLQLADVRSQVNFHLRVRHLRPCGWRARPAEPRRQSGAGFCSRLDEERAQALLRRADGRRRCSDAPDADDVPW